MTRWGVRQGRLRAIISRFPLHSTHWWQFLGMCSYTQQWKALPAGRQQEKVSAAEAFPTSRVFHFHWERLQQLHAMGEGQYAAISSLDSGSTAWAFRQQDRIHTHRVEMCLYSPKQCLTTYTATSTHARGPYSICMLHSTTRRMRYPKSPLLPLVSYYPHK